MPEQVHTCFSTEKTVESKCFNSAIACLQELALLGLNFNILQQLGQFLLSFYITTEHSIAQCKPKMILIRLPKEVLFDEIPFAKRRCKSKLSIVENFLNFLPW